ARLNDVTWFDRRSGWHVGRRADETDDVHGQLQATEGLHRAQHAGGAAHVELHPLHALRRLDRDPTGIEAKPFAHQANRLRILGAAPVFEHDQLRIFWSSLRDAEK